MPAKRRPDAENISGSNISTEFLPEHIAIIMDGNGRWAQKRGWPRFWGHREGTERVREIIFTGSKLGLKFLTLYAFSEENWQRPAREVSFLMNLLASSIRRFVGELDQNGVQLRIIGNVEKLPLPTRNVIRDAVQRLSSNSGMVVTLALSYSGKDELMRAMRRIASDVSLGVVRPEDIDEQSIRNALDMPQIPDPDLLIRTSGEVRISNFMLWQIAYSEMIFSPVLWPDFDSRCLREAILEFQRRNRRFGQVGEESSSTTVGVDIDWLEAASLGDTHA